MMPALVVLCLAALCVNSVDVAPPAEACEGEEDTSLLQSRAASKVQSEGHAATISDARGHQQSTGPAEVTTLDVQAKHKRGQNNGRKGPSVMKDVHEEHLSNKSQPELVTSTTNLTLMMHEREVRQALGRAAIEAVLRRLRLNAARVGCWTGIGLMFLLAARQSTKEDSDSERSPMMPKLVAEFVGTYILVFTVGCAVLLGDAAWGVLSIACALMVCIYALGGVSGGNFNPAVSFALGLTEKMPWQDVVCYIHTQFGAGILASMSYTILIGETSVLGPTANHTWWQAGLAEILYTFLLVFTVLNVAASRAHAGKDQFYGLAIGFCVVAGGYGAGTISGGCFNPAVAVGLDASGPGWSFGWCVIYLVFEGLGALLAAGLFFRCRPNDFDESMAEEPFPMQSKVLSEFIGTYMLVLTVGLNVLGGSKAGVYSIAASLMSMIFALGSVSGANFNPAVTAAIVFAGRNKMTMPQAGAYVSAQLCGGLAAAFTYTLLEGGRTVMLQPSGSWVEAMVGEMIFTFLLSFVVLCVATVQSPLTQYFGLAIGSCVTAGGLAIGSISGGSLNPAVSTALSFSDLINGGSILPLPCYFAAEILGGALASGVFRVTHRSEYEVK